MGVIDDPHAEPGAKLGRASGPLVGSECFAGIEREDDDDGTTEGSCAGGGR